MTAVFKEMPAEWSREDWLANRRLGIGASDVASICGLSTFGSPTSVYYDKVGLAPEQPENEAMRWGRLLEPSIAAEFAVETDLHVICPQLLVLDDEHPWRRATLDGLVVESPNAWPTDALGTIQIKTTRDPEYDEIPDRIALQCAWEMGVSGLEHCWLAVLHGGQKLRVYELDFDERVFERLAVIVDRFWLSNVVAENPPPADSNPATTDALKRAWNDRADGSVIELDESGLCAAAALLAAKARLKEAESTVALVENKLRESLGSAEFGADADGVELVSWRPQAKARRIDEKALRAEHPEIWEQYRSHEGTTRVLRATKALRALVSAERS